MKAFPNRWWFIGVAALAALAALAAYGALIFYADPLGLFLLAYAGLWLAAFGSVAAWLSQFVIRGRRNAINRAIAAFAWLAGICVVILFSSPLNSIAQERAVAEAKAYPDRVAPLLEEYRKQHGAYPGSLNELSPCPSIPRLLRPRNGYRSDGNEYWFSFPRPGGMIDVWGYSSKTHAWRLWT